MSRFSLPTLVIMLLTIASYGCSSIPTHKPVAPTVDLESVRALKLTLNRQELALRLKVYNPNTYDLPLQLLNFTASIDGSVFATGISDERITLHSEQDTIVEVRVDTRLNRLLAQLLLFSTSDQKEVDYKVTGFVELANWPSRIPFNVDGELENPGLAQ